ncbi:hypothetical protein KVF89_22220 [Nocardioides carbamazepini]|uniref:hypothetical protein n=1 Tax=Nocardioides carbamazepini TaxID=2854259 RepID=UPI002149F5B7|nr:hypothetical protein [Nocardioides carbamazepini]MCR1785272.1 hypothetical protein [Nocardioides carbamazepini]
MEAGSRRFRVPVEHRFLGLDRRGFPYAFSVLAIFLVATVVVPRIDKAINWDDPVAAGDQLALSERIVFTPATGWNVQSGFRAPHGEPAGRSGGAALTGGGVVLTVAPDSFDGTPTELLAQIQKVTSATDDPSFRVDGKASTVSTMSGEVGVLQSYSSVRGDGLIAAFVIDGTGIKVTAYGPPVQLKAAAERVHAMITSIHAVDPSTGSGTASEGSES